MTARKRLLAALALGSLTMSGCGFTGLYNAPLPGGADLGNHPYEVTAYFDNVLDLVPQSAVKVNDIPVGKVTKISLAECNNPQGGTVKVWCARVVVEVNDSVDLPSNARAEVAQTSLLGEKYVALEQPTGPAAGTKLVNGSQIPLSLTQSAPDAEQVLGALSLVLNKGGLDQIQVIASELNKALDGKDRQAAIRDLLTQLNTFTGTLDDQKDKITTSLANVNTLAKTLRQQEGLLDQALDTFPQALQVLSQERGKLVTLLSSLSNLGTVATRVINASQTDLVAALKSLDPVVTKLAEAGDSLPKALRIAGTFPFPLGLTREIVKGDYANLDADVTVNLSDVLCTLGTQLPDPAGKALCTLGQTLGKKAGSTKVSMKAAPSATLTPTLIGSGG